MTPDDEPLDPIDEVASALVDGEAGPASPEVTARAAAFRRVAAAVADDGGIEVDDEQRERSIAAALAAFDEPAPTPVGDLASRRAARARWLRPLGVAAAIVAAVAVGIGSIVVARDDGHDDETTAAVALDDQADAGGSASAESAPVSPLGDSGGGGASVGSGSTASDAGLPEFLGSFATYDELVTEAEAQASVARRSTTAASPDPAVPSPTTTFPFTPYLRCPAPAGPFLLVTQGWLDTQPVEVYVVDGDDAPEVIVLRLSDCSAVEG